MSGALLLAGLLAVALLADVHLWRQVRAQRALVGQLRAEVRRREREMERLRRWRSLLERGDPRAVERLAKRKWGWARRGEWVYVFPR